MDSDVPLIAQIFGDHQYDAGEHHMEVLRRIASQWNKDGVTPLIIDAGSNVGYSTLFFADNFPSATVIGVEPDSECVSMSRANCAGNSRIKIVNAALWWHSNGVQLNNLEGPSWARRVSDHGSTPSTTLESLISKIPNARPLLLKMDIEGAEREVCTFSGEAIRQFPCIMIEPHDWMMPGAGCLATLYSAICVKEMDTLIAGENLIFLDSEMVRNEMASGL